MQAKAVQTTLSEVWLDTRKSHLYSWWITTKAARSQSIFKKTVSCCFSSHCIYNYLWLQKGSAMREMTHHSIKCNLDSFIKGQLRDIEWCSCWHLHSVTKNQYWRLPLMFPQMSGGRVEVHKKYWKPLINQCICGWPVDTRLDTGLYLYELFFTVVIRGNRTAIRAMTQVYEEIVTVKE